MRCCVLEATKSLPETGSIASPDGDRREVAETVVEPWEVKSGAPMTRSAAGKTGN
jgi:hypothetical protein